MRRRIQRMRAATMGVVRAPGRGVRWIAARVDRVDLLVFGGYALLAAGAIRVDLEGGLMLTGALLALLGLQAARQP